jgi:hypothetical protein
MTVSRSIFSGTAVMAIASFGFGST